MSSPFPPPQRTRVLNIKHHTTLVRTLIGNVRSYPVYSLCVEIFCLSLNNNDNNNNNNNNSNKTGLYHFFNTYKVFLNIDVDFCD